MTPSDEDMSQSTPSTPTSHRPRWNDPGQCLPSQTIDKLRHAPRDRALILLMRHSIRGPLPQGENGDAVELLPEGVELAARLGGLLGQLDDLPIVGVHSSPVKRCIQTAEEIRKASGTHVTGVDIMPNLTLPGHFLLETKTALRAWHDLTGAEVLRRMSAPLAEPVPGMAPAEEAALALVQELFQKAADVPGLHIFVTHDSLVLPVAARFLDRGLTMEDWPSFLEGILLFREDVADHGGASVPSDSAVLAVEEEAGGEASSHEATNYVHSIYRDEEYIRGVQWTSSGEISA